MKVAVGVNRLNGGTSLTAEGYGDFLIANDAT